MKISQENIIIRGRKFSPSEIDLIKVLVLSHSDLSRRKLSILICEKLEWRQANGNLKDRACRDVLIRLNNKGIITLLKPISDFTTQTAGVKHIDFNEPCCDTTKENKSRLAVLEVLKNGAPLQYCLNQQAFEITSQLKLGEKYLNPFKILASEIEYTENEFEYNKYYSSFLH